MNDHWEEFMADERLFDHGWSHPVAHHTISTRSMDEMGGCPIHMCEAYVVKYAQEGIAYEGGESR